jgi:hypothetical protein
MPYLLRQKGRGDRVESADTDEGPWIAHPSAPSGASQQACGAVLHAIDGIRASIDGDVLPAAPVIERFIDIWSMARQVDPALAKPAEFVLSALAGRHAISAAEVRAACEQIERAVATASRPDVA